MVVATEQDPVTGASVPAVPGSVSALSRRRVLRAAGRAALGMVAAPWFHRSGAGAQAATPASETSRSAQDDLASRLTGHMLRPDDAMYPAAAIINAARYQGTRPEGIAVCAAPEDAAESVSWAREHGVPFAMRSGGHSYAGFSTSDGLVIDVKGMRAVSVDPARGTVTVAGAPTTLTSATPWRRTASTFLAADAPRLGSPG